MSANNDSDDLEALFDSIAASSVAAPEQPKVTPAPAASSDTDSDDLQALFDSVAAKAETTQGGGGGNHGWRRLRRDLVSTGGCLQSNWTHGACPA